MSESSSAQLHQMCELARQQKGLALVFLINKVLSNPRIYVFNELLSISSVAALGSQHNSMDDDSVSSLKSYKTLELFAYGTYRDYANNPGSYIDLTPDMLNKLKQLSIVTMAVANKVLSYYHLQKSLDIDNVRELEDLIISTMYSGLITGKMNQRESLLSVQNFIGRDVRREEIPTVIDKLTAFKNRLHYQGELVTNSSMIVEQRRTHEAKQDDIVMKIVSDNKFKLRNGIK
jgi:COP9 signalosome complex subunit 7